MIKKRIYIILLLLSFTLPSCQTYHQKNSKFNRFYEEGKIEKADKLLEDDKKAAEGRSKLLYYLNRGQLNALMGKYEESNRFFEQALLIHEDYQKNYLREAAALVTNPMMLEYKGEDFEILLAYYYKALNYLNLGNYEAALVETRRMNNKLNQFSDKYKGEKKYKRDAFINNLMGIIYDAQGDYNNAFIAYRNAYNI
jgi:uncharacterized protein